MPQGNKSLGTFSLNGKQINAPIEWNTIETLCTFDKEAVQANISIDKFTFVNDEAKAIIDYVNGGLSGGYGIFRGMPCALNVYNESSQVSVFDGLVDLTDGLEYIEWQNKVKCKLKLRSELLTLEQKLTCLSYGYLESVKQGNRGVNAIYSDTDYTEIKYVVQKKIDIMLVITTGIMIYILIKELITVIEKTIKDVGNIAGHTGGGLPIFAILSGIVVSIIITIVDTLYGILIVAALIELSETLLNELIPFKRTAKCLKMRTALEKVANYLGWKFFSSIPDLDCTYYLPSNQNFDETSYVTGLTSMFKGTPKGIPSSTDYGYQCADMFDISKKLFNGKFAIIDGTLYFENVDSTFWIKRSAYEIPSVRDKVKQWNTDELMASRLLSFEVDYTDEHTIESYLGTSYQVITNSITPAHTANKTDPDTFIKGLEEIRFGVCLAKRKDKLFAYEEAFLKPLARNIDKVISIFNKKNKNKYQSKLKDSLGIMIIGVNNYAKPKVIKCDSAMKLVERDQWSASYIYDTYYKGKSFVSTINNIPYYGQKIVYKGVKIPFGMADYLKVITNSYIITDDGKEGKITSLKWRFSSDYAIVDYYVHEVYTKNLTETFIEPSNSEINTRYSEGRAYRP
jgi:hypothetical protein